MSSRTTGPSWATIGNMDQARLRRTARRYADRLPTDLARLADYKAIGSIDAARLHKWCADNRLPVLQAGRTT